MELRALLGRDPVPAGRFVAPAERESILVRARLAWLLPLLRASLAIVWIATGIVSAFVYPVEESLALVARTGLEGATARAALYGAALFDVAMGVGILVLVRRRWLWILQAAAILAYTAIITVALPEYWTHPYGPILKNIPMLAAIGVLYVLEGD